MKVMNPNPRLVNIYVDGEFIKIGPNQTADVDAKVVKPLLETGDLVKSTGNKNQETEQEASETEDEQDDGGKEAGNSSRSTGKAGK